MECCCSNWAEYITAGAAVIALIVSWYQYQLHRDRERSKVFSSLNERYVNNKDVQAVVRYLSKTGPVTEVPDDYRTELFLRFFEEVGVYLKSKSLEPQPVEQLFGYYLYEIYTSDKGLGLLKVCKYKDSEWKYLVDFRECMSKIDEKWSKVPAIDFSDKSSQQ